MPGATPGGAGGSPAAHARVGRYEVRGELGRGGMGAVLRAFDPQLAREVAIKLVLDPARLGERGRERFQREARAVARLDHPGIVGVHEVGEHEGSPFLVMDLVEGVTLERAVRADEVSPRRLAEIAREVALALHHAHQAGVLHRDVKPENVLIDAEGRPRLVDFGLARTHDAGVGLTRSGEMLGTPHYVSPEQARGDLAAVGPRSDVYSLGGMLYFGLTRRPPFEGDSMLALLGQVFDRDPTPPRELEPRVHRDLETIALRCLEKDPARRYATASEVAADLGRFLADEPIAARPLGRFGRVRRWARRNRLLAAAIAVAVLALLAGGASVAGVRAETRRRLRAERVGVLDDLRAAAAERAAEFDRARSDPAVAREGLLTLGLDALGAAEALRGAAALGDASLREAATREAFEVAMASGEVALADAQWSVAAGCFDRARRLGVDDDRAVAALRGVEEAREQLVRDRRAAVERALHDARTTEQLARRGGYEDALFALTRWPERQTVELIVAELTGLTDRMREAVRKTLLEAFDPTEKEKAAGKARLHRLPEVVDRLLALPPGAKLGEKDDWMIREARSRLAGRAAESRSETQTAGAATADPIIAAAQARAVGPTGLDLARLCCEALGRLRIRPRALQAVADYLFVEHDQRRAIPAGRALCLLGGDEAERLMLAARDRWSRWSHFWRQTRHHLERTGVQTELGEDSSEAYLERAKVLAAKGDREGAIADLDRALELDDTNVDAWTERGGLKQGLKPPDYEGSIADTTRALELDPKNQLALIHRGFALMSSDDPEAAIADFDRVAELSPHHDAVLWCRGLARWTKGDHEGALADFDAAIERTPGSPRAHKERGRLRLRMGDVEGAIADLEKLVELTELDAKAWELLGDAHHRRGDLAASLEAIERAIALDPDSDEALLIRAIARRKSGDFERALVDIDQVIGKRPDDLVVRIERAMLRGAVGDRRGSIEDYTVAIAASPRNAMLWNNRSYALLCLGEVDAALADADRAVEIDPEHPYGWTTRGEIHMARGDFDAAIVDLTRATELDEDGSGVTYQRIAQTHLLLGDRAAAEAAWARAREKNPELPARIGRTGVPSIDERLERHVPGAEEEPR